MPTYRVPPPTFQPAAPAILRGVRDRMLEMRRHIMAAEARFNEIEAAAPLAPPQPGDPPSRNAAWLREHNESYARRAARLTPEARERARGLLLSFLDAPQRLEFEEYRRITLTGRSGRRYIIEWGRSGNIIELDQDARPLRRLCAHPHEMMPVEDVMLAQLVHLRDDDLDFAQLANAHPYYAPSTGAPAAA